MSDGMATLTVTSQVAVTVGSLSGALIVRGTGAEPPAVTVNALSSGSAVMWNREGVSMSLPAGDYVSLTTEPDSIRLSADPARPVSLGVLALDPARVYTLQADGGHSFCDVPSNVRIVGAAGAVATVLAGHTPVSLRMTGGQITVGAHEAWRGKVSYWFDASLSDSLEQTTFNDTVYFYKDRGGYPLIQRWADARVSQSQFYLANVRDDYFEFVFPFAVPYAEDPKLHYLACANIPGDAGVQTRRLGVKKAGAAANITPKTAVLVFGSQCGGGRALFANAKGAFARMTNEAHAVWTDWTLPMTTNALLEVWADGVKIDPTATGFNGGWQVLTVNTKGLPISGIGYAKTDYQDAGGQNYAEILFFNEELGDADRIAAERYLAQKWGLTASYTDLSTPAQLSAFGTGTVTLDTDAVLDGAYAGTVGLNGRTLALGAGALPPSDADIPAEGRISWLDPDWTGPVAVNGEIRQGVLQASTSTRYQNPRLALRLYDRDGTVDGQPSLQSSGDGRAPAITSRAALFGPVRTWLDYGNFYTQVAAGAETQGNMLRYTAYPTSGTTSTPLANCRTVVMVQDSVYGGGSPFMDSIFGTAIPPRFRGGDTPSALTPIWHGANGVDRALDIFGVAKGGHTYLDGREVDGATQGFSGGPEVFTAVGGTAFNIAVFGSHQVNEGVAENRHAEIHGEILVYDRVLSDEERTTAEAYLMYKWLGLLPDGFTVSTNVTVTGGGRLEAASASRLPKFAPGFSGEVALVSSALAFDIRDGVVRNVLDLAQGTLALAGSTPVTVQVVGPLGPGDYTLVAGGVPADADLELTLTRTASAGSLRVSDGRLSLVVKSAETCIIVR